MSDLTMERTGIDAVVEAACRTAWGATWDSETPRIRAMLRAQAKRFITAAAPHLAAAVREETRAAILTDVHSEGNGVPLDSHYDVALIAAWIDEWFDR